MLKPNMELELNNQINEEMFSSYIYLSMSSYFQKLNLTGMALWMRHQADEETIHAMKIFDYILERGGAPILQQIAAPALEWDSPLAAFENSYAHEVHISERINLLVDIAIKESDHATNNFLQWFIAEQVEEEATVDEVVQRLKLVGDSGNGLLLIDQELSQRNAPVAGGEAGA